MTRQDIQKIGSKQTDIDKLEFWLYQKLDSLVDTRNIVEKGMYVAYEDVLKHIDQMKGGD